MLLESSGRQSRRLQESGSERKKAEEKDNSEGVHGGNNIELI
jgi:hypothetical protein